MKRIYERYIKIPEDKNISDSVLKSRITLSVISILSCFAIMLSTAFAFFNTNLETKFTMRAATWDVNIAETMADDEIRQFILTPYGTATEGYCEIVISGPDGDAKYCTSSFQEAITLSIQATADCTIKFIPRWGKNASDYGDGDLIVLSKTPTKSIVKSESAQAEEDEETPSQSVSDTSSETPPIQPETSINDEDLPLSSESSNDSQSNSVEDTSSTSPDEGSSSSESDLSSESDKTIETTTTPAQSSSDSESFSSSSEPESSSSSSADNSSSSDSGTASDSSASSSGGDSTPAPSVSSSADNGSDE